MLSPRDLSLVERELDWVMDFRLVQAVPGQAPDQPGRRPVARLDLAYHDISRTEGLYHLLVTSAAWWERVITDVEAFEATAVGPEPPRGKLRGDFVRRAPQEARRDYTVDWVHLRLNDQAQRTVLCKDPFRNVDERVDRLLESM